MYPILFYCTFFLSLLRRIRKHAMKRCKTWANKVHGLYSWFQCCVYTLNFRHDSTVMIQPRGYQAGQYFTLNILQESKHTIWKLLNNSLNVSLVIQKKRTVIHDLFSFSDNSLSCKSRNLIAIHVIGRVDVSINKFFGSFLNFLWPSTLILKKYHILPYFNKNRCCFLLCMVFLICAH